MSKNILKKNLFMSIEMFVILALNLIIVFMFAICKFILFLNKPIVKRTQLWSKSFELLASLMYINSFNVALMVAHPPSFFIWMALVSLILTIAYVLCRRV